MAFLHQNWTPVESWLSSSSPSTNIPNPPGHWNSSVSTHPEDFISSTFSSSSSSLEDDEDDQTDGLRSSEQPVSSGGMRLKRWLLSYYQELLHRANSQYQYHLIDSLNPIFTSFVDQLENSFHKAASFAQLAHQQNSASSREITDSVLELIDMMASFKTDFEDAIGQMKKRLGVAHHFPGAFPNESWRPIDQWLREDGEMLKYIRMNKSQSLGIAASLPKVPESFLQGSNLGTPLNTPSKDLWFSDYNISQNFPDLNYLHSFTTCPTLLELDYDPSDCIKQIDQLRQLGVARLSPQIWKFLVIQTWRVYLLFFALHEALDNTLSEKVDRLVIIRAWDEDESHDPSTWSQVVSWYEFSLVDELRRYLSHHYSRYVEQVIQLATQVGDVMTRERVQLYWHHIQERVNQEWLQCACPLGFVVGEEDFGSSSN